MVVTHITRDRKAALHLWDHQLYVPEVGSPPPGAWRTGSCLMDAFGLLPPPLHLTTFGLFLLIKEYFFSFSHSCLGRYLNMGNLLKVLTCTDLEQGPNFFLDFESEKMILYTYYSLPAVDCVCHVLNVCFHFAIFLTALHAWAMSNCSVSFWCKWWSTLKYLEFVKCKIFVSGRAFKLHFYFWNLMWFPF